MNNNFNNIDVNKLMEMLSKMDKSQIEQGLAQAANFLNNNNNDNILNKLKNKE